ncbi:MAG: rane protein [Gemmatimonadetes bacterium]|nr:rane protein [Gemmatimonadota bacterium]
MHDQALRDRLIEHGLAGRYSAFVRAGLLFALLGAVLFAVVLSGGNGERAWQAFLVNWLFFTGLAGGSVALTAVHKIVQAKWSGVLLRFSQAAVAFLPVSLVGLLLIFTVGYQPIYGHMTGQLHSVAHGKAVWLSHGFMFSRLVIVLTALFAAGWALVRADMIPDLFLARGRAGARRNRLYQAWTAGFDGSADARERQHARIARLAAIYVPLYALGFTLIAFDMIMALQPHWFSNLLGGFYFMASFL